MADVITEFGHITPRTAGHVVRKLLKAAFPRLVTDAYIQPYVVPNYEGKVAKWRRYDDFTSATTPLAEGVAPDGQRLTYTDIQCVLEQYGDICFITDVIQDTHEDRVINNVAVPVCSRQMARTKEENRIAVWKAGTSVYYAGGTTITARNQVASAISRGDLLYVIRQLDANYANEISSLIKASPNYDTEPIPPSYFAFGHTDLYADIKDIPGFIPAANYGEPGMKRDGEVGSVDRIRFILTPLFTPFTDSGAAIGSDGFISTSDVLNDVYPIIVLAENAVAGVVLRGGFAVKPFVVNPNIPDHYNKLGQLGHVGWKIWDGNKILDDNMIYRIECACTENPS